MRIYYAIQTNSTILDGAWCHFFKSHNFLVGLSLDGPANLHDIYRVDKTGQPTFERVMQGLALLKEHHVEFNILTCVHAKNADQPIEIYQFLRDEVEAQFIQFTPVVERESQTGFYNNKATNRSVSGSQYGEFLI